MKHFKTRKLYILIILSVILSAGIIRSHKKANVPFCMDSPGCHLGMEPSGTLTKKLYGYPLTYKEIATFQPVNGNSSDANYAGYAETSMEEHSFVNILINTLFWFGVLKFLNESAATRGSSANKE